MKKLLALLTLMGCMSSTNLKENGNIRTIEAKNFHNIRCEYCADIQYTQGKEYAVTASGSDQTMKQLHIYQEGKTLVIARKEPNKKKSDKEKVYLRITAPEINRLDVGGVMKFRTGKMTADDFEINVGGVSDFQCEKLVCKNFTYDIKGVSKGKAQIEAQTAHINCKGVDTSEFQIYSPELQLNCKGVCNMDLDFRGVRLSREYTRQLPVLNGGNLWDIMMAIEKHPILRLKEDEVSQLEQVQHMTIETPSAGNLVFRNFLKLLTTAYPKPRSVSYYSNRLCITPKYLSTVCKEYSGHTTSELINQCVAKDIQLLLKKREQSIKDICNELDFPSLSFFGRYVKRHLGMSPRQWRDMNPYVGSCPSTVVV